MLNTLKEKFEKLKREVIEGGDSKKRDINLVAELKAVVRINIETQKSRLDFFDSMFSAMFQGNDYICQKSENLTKFIDMSTVNNSPPNPSWATEKSIHYNLFFDQQVKNRKVVADLELLMVKLDEVIAEDAKNKESSENVAFEVFSLLGIAVENEEKLEKLQESNQLLEKKVCELEIQLDKYKKQIEEQKFEAKIEIPPKNLD